MVPTLRAMDPMVQKLHVNAAHAVHNNLKVHTRGTLSLGEVTVYNTRIYNKKIQSQAQSLN